MSNISDTTQVQVSSVDAIVDRLHGTVALVSKLRLSLDELETELSEIRQQCENAFRTKLPVVSVDKAHEQGRDAPKSQGHNSHRAKVHPGPVSLQNWPRNPDRSNIGTSRGIIGEPREQQEQRRTKTPISESKLDPKSNPTREILALSTKNQSKGHLTSPSRIPRITLRISGGRRSPPDVVIEKGDTSPGPYSQSRIAVTARTKATLVPPHRHAENLPIAEKKRATHPPHPPTDPFPFPKDLDINLSSYPPELKRKGDDWFVLFNPSSKAKRILDVTLVHDTVNDNWATCVRFSRDGKWLATGCLRTAQIYDVKTGVQTCVLTHPEDIFIWCVCFSPDGTYLVTGAGDLSIRIWNIADKQIYRTFEGHNDYITSVDFSPNGQFIVSGSFDKSIRIWDVHGGTLKVLTVDDHYLPDESRVVRSLAISPDGRYLAVGSYDMSLSIWEVPTGVLVQRLRGHKYDVVSVAFMPDGKRLISGGVDRTLKYWDMSELDSGSGASIGLTSTSPPPCLMNLTGHNDRVNSIAASHDGTWVVSSDDDGKVLIWDARTGVAQCMLAAHDVVSQVDLSAIGNIFATVGWDGHTRIWSYDI